MPLQYLSDSESVSMLSLTVSNDRSKRQKIGIFSAKQSTGKQELVAKENQVAMFVKSQMVQ